MPICQPLEACKMPDGDYHLVQRDPHDPLAKHHVELIATVHARRGFVPGTADIAHLLAAAPDLYEAAIAAEHLLADLAEYQTRTGEALPGARTIERIVSQLQAAIAKTGVAAPANHPGGHA